MDLVDIKNIILDRNIIDSPFKNINKKLSQKT